MKVRAEAAVLLLAGIGHCLVASHARAEPAPVRVTYRAIEGCPSEEEFLERVRSRTLRASFAAPGDLARSFDVALERVNGTDELLGRLEFVDLDGNQAQRSLRGATCDQLASSLALITALAIDDRGAEVAPGDGTPPASAPAIPSPATAPRNAVVVPPPSRGPEPIVVADSPTKRRRWEIGANAGGLTLFTNGFGPLLGIYAEFGPFPPAWSVRLSAFDSRLGAGDGSRRADFAANWLRLEACPLALGFGGHLSLLPCLSVDAGQLRAHAPNAVGSTGPQSVGWASVGGLARLKWLFDERLVLTLDGELGAPLVRRSFRFVNADNSLDTVVDVPKIGVGVKFGVGVRFP